MVRNGKYFVLPDANASDFKALFKKAAASGVGRPVDALGAPEGPWTPDLLADAISQIDANRNGIELRTVQLWFQDNDRGISTDNIRWLARVFGCDDRDGTRAWQAELTASMDRLAAKRRGRKAAARAGDPSITDNPTALPDRPSLAARSEAIFTRKSFLNLPAIVFAGAAALNFLAYFLGIHSITYVRADGVTKQVGFHWAPNWTFLFMLFLPLFFVFAMDLLSYWRTQGRQLVLASSEGDVLEGWRSKVDRSSGTFWAVLLICVLFAGVLQWVALRLIPLMQSYDNGDIDWGSIALERPEIISPATAAAFTGLAYLYMALCFYLMFVGLILLYTLVHDLWEIRKSVDYPTSNLHADGFECVVRRVMDGIVRCTLLGMLVAICMDAQYKFLETSPKTIWSWLFADAGLISLDPQASGDMVKGFGTSWPSLLIALPSCIVFAYAIARQGTSLPHRAASLRMSAALSVVVAAYLLIGAFPGFSILLGIAVVVALYGLFDPDFDARRVDEQMETPSVP